MLQTAEKKQLPYLLSLPCKYFILQMNLEIFMTFSHKPFAGVIQITTYVMIAFEVSSLLD